MSPDAERVDVGPHQPRQEGHVRHQAERVAGLLERAQRGQDLGLNGDGVRVGRVIERDHVLDHVLGKVEPDRGERLLERGHQIDLLHPALGVGLGNEAVDPAGDALDQVEELRHLDVGDRLDANEDLPIRGM